MQSGVPWKAATGVIEPLLAIGPALKPTTADNGRGRWALEDTDLPAELCSSESRLFLFVAPHL
jgi:hypothetical protein